MGMSRVRIARVTVKEGGKGFVTCDRLARVGVGTGQMCLGTGPYNGTSCPCALGAGKGTTMYTLSCRCFARPPTLVGPLMTLRAGWRLGQANYMAPSPPRPNNYTATCTERVANCVTSCKGRARAPLKLMSFPQSIWGRTRRGYGRQTFPIPSPPWFPAPGRVAGCAGGREQ